MSTTQTIQFTTDLGPGIALSSGNVIVYKIEENAPKRLLTEIVDASTFELSLQLPGPGHYYITLEVINYQHDGNGDSTGPRDIRLLATFDETSDIVCIGAPSTIAAAYTFARFIRLTDGIDPVIIAAKPLSATIAYGMKKNFLNVDGTISKVISTPPNAMQTNSYAMFNFLSNLAYYNITDTNIYNEFLSLVSTPDHECTYFLEALMNLVHAPFTNVQEIYNLINTKTQVYQPSLPDMKLPEGKSPVPNQWTLTIKANNSGTNNFLISGTAYVVFDKEGKAWIANNFRMGTPDSGTHCIVLNPDASPCSFSPITGGGILGVGFGIAVNNAKDKIAIGNYGWGTILHNPEEGSMSMFTSDGKALTPSTGITNKLSRVQGLTYDQKGNLWLASMGSQAPMVPTTPDSIYTYDGQNSAVVVYLADGTLEMGVNPDKAILFDQFGNNNPNESYGTFDVVIDSEGHGIASNTGNENAGLRSSVYKFKLENGQLVKKYSWESDHVNTHNDTVGYEEFRQVQVNGQDHVFVGGVTSHRIIKLDKELKKVGEFKSETLINGPWGITIDKQGTMYVANFGRDKERAGDNTLDMNSRFGITVIHNEDMSTAQMMTLPTGGDSVTLANGQQLYGTMTNPQTGEKFSPLCYEPLMRLTSAEIDGAGNLWAMNNWKPAATVDVTVNPGGDGVVIFIGVAEPS
jgi:hypothetical protein